MTMKTFINYGLRVTILLYTLIHIVTSFNEQSLLMQLLSYIGLAIIIFSMLAIPLRDFKLPLFILLIAIIILFYSQTNIFSGILLGVQQMRNVIGILVIIPLISWVLQEEPYIEDMMSVFHNFINTSKKFYFTMISLTQVLTYFLLFGSINMMYQFIDIILKDQKSEIWQRYKGTALLRGYGLSTLWVITVPSFIVVVDTLGASIYISIAQGFGIALVGTILAVLFVAPTERKHNLNITPILQTEINNVLLTASTDIKTRKRNVIEFFLLFFSLFGAIFFIYSIWNIPLMTLIPLTIIGWIITFYLYKQRMYKLKSIAKQYFSNELGKKAYQVALMLSIGTLIYSLNQTNFAENVVGGLNAIENVVSWLNPLYLLPFIVIILGLMGLGPLTVMVLVAGILESLNLPYPPELIVLSITSGSVISILISPVLMPLIVLSDSNGLNLFTNGIKSNWKYAFAFFIVTQIYIQIMMHIW
ncbi:MAG TPA: hypothetical protein VK121_00095 [Pseudogracilibacillus sp.]|nr:hypothetical protein [Pseudogracilibacillus sp.]